MITLPTNRDENWRYANLRPLTRARPEAVDPAAAATTAVSLPAPVAGFERWVFVDGRFARHLSTPSADSCATLLHARDPALLVPFLRGDALFTRLEGEWWTRFNGEPAANAARDTSRPTPSAAGTIKRGAAAT